MKIKTNFITSIIAVLITSLTPASLTTAYAAGLDATSASSTQSLDGTDRFIIKMRNGSRLAAQSQGASPDMLDSLSSTARMKLSHHRLMSDGAQVLKLPWRMRTEDIETLARALSARPDVEYAVPDRLVQPLLLPNDTQFGNQWHYQAPNIEIGGVNLPGAWDITIGAAAVVAAVIDTGILPHADLAGRSVPGYDFISTTFISNDGDERDNDPTDPGDWASAGECGTSARNSTWHGTHVSGTVGAASNNGQGVTGVNWGSRVLPVRVLGKCGGYISDIIDGMRWSAGLPVPGVPTNVNPARVMNLSLGGGGTCDPATQSAVDDVTAAGAVVVVAAGNSNASASNSTPGSCAGVITVAATTRLGSKASYSNYGTDVEIAAPGGGSGSGSGGGVLSTHNTGNTLPVADEYDYKQGTSMATPHVAGIVALMFSANPALTPAEVLANIQSTARAFPTGTINDCTTLRCGSGIIDAAAAVGQVSRLLRATPGALTFAQTQVGQNSAVQMLSISNTNTGTTALNVNSVNLVGAQAADFSITSNTCTGSAIPAEGSCTVGVRFSPDAAGSRSASLNITSNAANATMTVALSGTGSGTGGGGQQLQFASTTHSAEEGNSVTVSVTRTGGTSGAVSVQYETSNATAVSGSDYTEESGILSWAAGDAAPKTFSVATLDNTVAERNETFNLSLSNPAGAVLGTNDRSSVLIRDDEPGQFRFQDTANATTEGDGSAVITVIRLGSNAASASVSYLATNNSALLGSDYLASAGVLSFSPGQDARTFSVPIVNDSVAEFNENVRLSLSAPLGAVLGSPASVNLLINDDGPSTMRFSYSSYTVNEGTASVTIEVRRAGNTEASASVAYATSDVTATAGADYVASAGTLNFAAGATRASLVLTIREDLAVEAAERVDISLSSPSGGILGTPNATTVTITSND